MNDLTIDPFEDVNIYHDPKYATQREYMEERLLFWAGNYVEADNAEVNITIQTDTWNKCGGVCPVVDDNLTIPIEQKYFYSDAPHIVFLLVDDWGWNDIGFRSTFMPWVTPNIDKLAENGIILENYYTHNFCVPSRGALMTGKQSGRLGLLEHHDGSELPLTEITIAQEMKSAGYQTYMIGKWHLGHSSYSRTPTFRGFDSFYGYYSGYIDYYTKYYEDYYDLQDGLSLDFSEHAMSEDTYSAILFAEKAEETIKSHSINHPNTPMFLYYAQQLVHYPLQAPSIYENRCLNYLYMGEKVVLDKKFIIDSSSNFADYLAYCAMHVILDEVISNLTCALNKYEMDKNLIFVIASDNGGEGTIESNSIPFKGHKYDYTRGGLSANAIVSSTLLSSATKGSTYSGQMHVSDWLPTLMNAATDGQWTGSFKTGNVLDGVDMWHNLLNLNESISTVHREIVHYVDAYGEGFGSIQIDMIKLNYNVDWVYEVGNNTVNFLADTDADPNYACDILHTALFRPKAKIGSSTSLKTLTSSTSTSKASSGVSKPNIKRKADQSQSVSSTSFLNDFSIYFSAFFFSFIRMFR